MEKLLLIILLFVTACTAPSRAILPTATVSAGGSIQASLNAARAVDVIVVKAGTYNESLTLKTSGTASLPITIKCETPLGCTVNSGTSISLATGGAIDYYIIDGFKFTSTSSELYTLDFGAGIAQPELTINAGNDHFIIRNSYIEGTVRFFGAYNLVENNEFGGNDYFMNAITDKWVSSHDNIYRNNKIHNYKVRGIWTMQRTNNILIEGNTIYNGQNGIDCDGAANLETRCVVRGNTVYGMTTGQGYGILFENCFDCIAEGNVIHDTNEGIQVINYGIGYTNDGIEYRTKDTGS